MEEATEGESSTGPHSLTWSYRVEQGMYGVAIVLGVIAVVFTLRRLMTSSSHQWELAARLVKYKISLTVADLIILFIYAPTQLLWISTYWWYGASFYCSFYKFLSTFGFHLTGNMQALIAIDRLNVMTKINRVTKESYNSTVALVLAWCLAFVCSIPQLFVFYVTTETGEPQCVSHWTMVFYHYDQKIGQLGEYNAYMEEVAAGNHNFVHPNGTEIRPLPAPNISIDYEEELIEYYQNLEQIYNVVHLTTIVFLPYLIELISYLLIILLLNAASTGQFIGFRAVIKRAILKLPCITMFFRMKASMRRHHEHSRERRRLQGENRMTRGRSSERIKSIHSKISVLKRSSKSQSSSPTEDHLNFDFPPSEVRLAGMNGVAGTSPDFPLSSPTPLIPIEVDNAGASILSTQEKQIKSESVLQYKQRSKWWRLRQTTIDPLFKTELKEEERTTSDAAEKGLLVPPSIQEESGELKVRRQSDPVKGGEKRRGSRILAAPWMKTVVKAKKNTKKKVFVMITINLICWLPYFAHALISSLKLNDEFSTKFQFYSALVVFNAISNILL
ncbi:hypothetical protein PMAYCL1PPCAC_02654 [Pristionchus mayeri]|uniref:G-protein coupled receptors family 1 profile domain-containing protein n=1 Tax=Pristionchus mayeri TaxID=1317129 RepID=A0AAN4Z3F2_9BILA|nr:hypothetical protein PMAYCL1PPCAC_02654 [Pristionchus mayeri]